MKINAKTLKLIALKYEKLGTTSITIKNEQYFTSASWGNKTSKDNNQLKYSKVRDSVVAFFQNLRDHTKTSIDIIKRTWKLQVKGIGLIYNLIAFLHNLNIKLEIERNSYS